MLHLQQFLSSPQFAQLLGLVFSGASVALVAQWLKRLSKLESEKVIQFMVIALAVLSSLLQYVSSNNLQSLSQLGVNTATIVGIAQALYLYAVKPLSGFVDGVRDYMANAMTQPTTDTDPNAAQAVDTFKL